jgi:hypothetical protein
MRRLQREKRIVSDRIALHFGEPDTFLGSASLGGRHLFGVPGECIPEQHLASNRRIDKRCAGYSGFGLSDPPLRVFLVGECLRLGWVTLAPNFGRV